MRKHYILSVLFAYFYCTRSQQQLALLGRHGVSGRCPLSAVKRKREQEADVSRCPLRHIPDLPVCPPHVGYRG
jgi:hypothetical protein